MSQDWRKEAIELERETRYWTETRWEMEHGDGWQLIQAKVRLDADSAIDELLTEAGRGA